MKPFPLHPAPPAAWRVYLLLCADGTFYTGITTDLARRLREHNGDQGQGSRYTLSRRPVRVVWSEAHPDRSSASKREWAVRRMSRDDKRSLANRENLGD